MKFSKLKLITGLGLILQLLSCVPQPPYEALSRCTAIEPSFENPYIVTPCVRRPLNRATI